MTTTRRKRTRVARPAEIASPAGSEALDLYIAEAARTPTLPAAEQKQLARIMRDESRPSAERAEARERLIIANLRFAFSIAKQYQNRGVELEDLVSEANAGLCRAADKYDPDMGVNFISYAVWWIRQAVFSAVTRQSRAVRVPHNRVGDLTRVLKAQAMLRERLTREPTIDEIARVAGLTAEVTATLLPLGAGVRSLDEPAYSAADDSTTLASVLRLEDSTAAGALPTAVEHDARREALRRALSTLPPRDRKVLELYYGLGSDEPMTLNQIASMLGVTRERVRQLRERALAALRGSAASDVLRDWAA